jgi:type VI protein secretion system component Hcp
MPDVRNAFPAYLLELDGFFDGDFEFNGKKMIPVWSWNWGEENEGHAGRVHGTVYMRDFEFLAPSGNASIELKTFCLEAGRLPALKQAVLYGLKNAGDGSGKHVVWLKLTLENARLTSYDIGGDADGQVLDRGSLSFEKVHLECAEVRPDGTVGPMVRVGWDVKKNAKA